MFLNKLFPAYLFLLVVAVVSGQGNLIVKWGGDLVIKADTPPPPGSSILWKINADKVVEYDKDFPSYGITPYGKFKGRTTLDRTTGGLKVTSLTNADNGLYSVEYDSRLQPKSFSVSVIKTVPKPTIASSCDENLKLCTLTCEGDTKDAGKVSYHWQGGVSKQTLQITSMEPTEFICELRNSVSDDRSEPLPNPLNPSGSSAGIIVAVLFVILLGVVCVIVAFYKVAPLNEMRKNWFKGCRRAPTYVNTEYSVVGGNDEGGATNNIHVPAKTDPKKQSEVKTDLGEDGGATTNTNNGHQSAETDSLNPSEDKTDEGEENGATTNGNDSHVPAWTETPSKTHTKGTGFETSPHGDAEEAETAKSSPPKVPTATEMKDDERSGSEVVVGSYISVEDSQSYGMDPTGWNLWHFYVTLHFAVSVFQNSIGVQGDWFCVSDLSILNSITLCFCGVPSLFSAY